jgi:hypothetical protein
LPRIFSSGEGGTGAGFGAGFFFFFAGVAFFMPLKPSQTGGDGATRTGAGFGAGFFFFFAFILRAGAPRFAVLDFFATSTSRSVQQNYANTVPHYASRVRQRFQ